MNQQPDQNSQFSSGADDGPGEAFENEGGPQAPDQAGDLGELLRKSESEAAELKDAWMRAKAETENVRRQGQNDVAKAHKFAIERFAQELLNVKDALELTLATPARPSTRSRTASSSHSRTCRRRSTRRRSARSTRSAPSTTRTVIRR